jgi:BirA family biotin operon repressor/biotin-[acetyl-CoA-carboxylase] ligase
VKEKSRLSLEKIKNGLETSFMGQRILYFEEAASTNDLAKELAEKGVEEGTVVIAETQTRGRGRLGRRWISPRGGIWFSVILRPAVGPKDAPKIVFMAAVAIAKTIRKVLRLTAKTKWPNDVLVRNKKVCGLLAETSTSDENINFVVLGIGINANVDTNAFPRELTGSLTSLKKEAKREIPREEFLRALLKEMEHYYNDFTQGRFARILDEWKSLTDMIGRDVEVVSFDERFEGKAIDVDQDGALIVKLEDESVKRVLCADASIRF